MSEDHTGDGSRPSLSPAARSALTLGVLVLLMIVGVLWGVRELTAPFGAPLADTSSTTTPDTTGCSTTVVPRGNQVTPSDVVVSVLNAGTVAGRATDVLQQLGDAGFALGQAANAPAGTKVDTVEVWSNAPLKAPTRLVLSALGRDARAVVEQAQVPGIVVVVGDGFDGVGTPLESVTARTRTKICGPADQ